MASDSALNRHVLNTTAPCYVKVEDGIPTTIGGAKLAIDSKLTEQRVFAQQPLWSQLASTDQHTWLVTVILNTWATDSYTIIKNADLAPRDD